MSGAPARAPIPGRFYFRALLASAMLSCVGLACYGFVRNIVPTWPGWWLPVLAGLVSLESIVSERLSNAPERHLDDVARFRIAEAVTLVLILRLVSSLSYGWSSFLGDLQGWTAEPWTILDLTFVLSAAVLGGFWVVARKLGIALQSLEADPFEHAVSPTDADYDLRSSMPSRGLTDRSAEGRRVAGIFLGGGAAILVLVGLSHINIAEMEIIEASSVRWLGPNLLAYFALGLALISEVRYATLVATWEVQEIPVLGRLGRRWLTLLAISLALVAVVAAFLPTSYSVSLYQALTQVIQWLIYGVAYAIMLVIGGVGYLLALIMSLFTGEPVEAPAMTPAMEMPVFEGNGGGTPAAWWPLVRSLIFWALIVGGGGYALLHFLQDRWGLFKGFRPWALLRQFWAWLVGLWHKAGEVVQQVREEAAKRRALRQSAAARSRRRSHGPLTPRERVHQLYRMALEVADRYGVGRAPNLTPSEYLPRLAPHVPEAEADLAELTRTFERARYSREDVSQSDVERAGSHCEALERALEAHAASEAAT